MRVIVFAAMAGLLVLPGYAHAQVSSGQSMRALNPQPEPPSLQEGKPLSIKKKTSATTSQKQDMLKLNPQPEPPSRLGR